MVKGKKQGRAGRKAAFLSNSAQTPPSNEAVSDGPRPSVRLQKKVNRKVNFLARVATSAVATGGGIKKKKPSAKKRVSRALADFSSLGDALQEMQEKQQKPNPHSASSSRQSVRSSVARKHIIKAENTRLQHVMAHPEYKANPLSAIASHLQATLPSVPAKPPAPKGKPAAKKSKASKQKRRGTAMEM